jgi:hypothetical protein
MLIGAALAWFEADVIPIITAATIAKLRRISLFMVCLCN